MLEQDIDNAKHVAVSVLAIGAIIPIATILAGVMISRSNPPKSEWEKATETMILRGPELAVKTTEARVKQAKTAQPLVLPT